ncbi:MAG: transposase, partial [Candidatus Binatia bacterium]
AHRDGFDLHADTAVRAGDRCRLERLCRYVLRPPVAQDALELTPEGRVLLRPRAPCRRRRGDAKLVGRSWPRLLAEPLAAQ